MWTVALQGPLSMGFPRHEHWSGLPIFFSRGSSQSRDQPASSVSPVLQVGSWKKKMLKKLVVAYFTSKPELGPED